MIGPLELLTRLVVGGLLLTAGLAKWRLGPRTFALAIQGYGILPRSMPLPVARAITAAEIAIGAGLIGGVALPTAALAAASLLVVFAAAMALTLARAVTTDCGCALFIKSERVSWRLVCRNLVLAAALAPVILGP